MVNLPSIEGILLISGVLIIVAVLLSKASSRLGIPVLLFFLGLGMVSGSEGIGGIYFDDPWIAQFLGSIALAYILFSGGLDTKWSDVKPVVKPAITLATLGVLITALLLGYFVHLTLKIPLLESLLLGSIVSSTDAAAVFSILRNRDVRLQGKIEPLLEFESGSNDPMAVLLTIGLTGLITNGNQSAFELIPFFLIQMSLGIAIGLLSGKFFTWLINRLNLKIEGLYTVFSIAIVLLIFGLTNVINGNGFMAVYLAGVMMGNKNFIHKRTLRKFHDSLAWLMQILMFLTLGLLVFPSQVLPVTGMGLLISIFLILIARPISVMICLIKTKFNLREKAMISWVGLRGAVPIILATFPLLAGVKNADLIFNIVFFVVITSSLIQGTSLTVMSKWLRVQRTPQARSTRTLPQDIELTSDGALTIFEVRAGASACGQKIMDLDIPEEVLIVLIERDQAYIIPRGDMTILEGDRLHVLLYPDMYSKVDKIFCAS
ncbi:MAG: potassium/proton antiporter [Anaerolineaceae bacterium]|nr:potassium/proton antiporter [Anaerolineaceae bacterium]